MKRVHEEECTREFTQGVYGTVIFLTRVVRARDPQREKSARDLNGNNRKEQLDYSATVLRQLGYNPSAFFTVIAMREVNVTKG